MKNKVVQLLKWSEKYTKTDMVYLASGGFWLTLGRFLVVISGLLLVIAFANLLPKETYGTYKYILSIGSILAIAALPGMATSINKSVAGGYEGSFIPALKTKIHWGSIAAIASLAAAGYYYLNDNYTLTFAFLISAMFLPFIEALGTYSAFLNGKKNFRTSSLYNTITQMTLVITMVLVLFFTRNLLLIIFAYYALNTLLNFIFLQITLRKFKPNKNIDPKTISYGKHLSLMNAIGVVVGHVDKILLWHFFGAAQLAIYSLALTPASQIVSFLKSIGTLAFPKFVAQDKETLKKVLLTKVFKFSALLVIPTLLYILLAPFLYELLFPQYIESIKYSQYYALIILFYPQRLITHALAAHADKKALYVLSTVNPIIRVIALLILLPQYGILGAIIALLLPSIVDIFLLIYFLKRM